MKSQFIRFTAASLLLCSCGRTQRPETSQREYVEEYCTKCHGTGKVKASTSYKAAIAIPTLGHSFLIDEIECDFCKGEGIILKPILNADTIRK